MHVINGPNVHVVLPSAMRIMQSSGVKRDSRNGPVVQLPGSVSTVYSRPAERVLFHPWRDANPFFHFYESLWMLAGRRDASPLARYVKRMQTFSDDGTHFNAAYGHRWRQYHEVAAAGYDTDQLSVIIEMLQWNPDDRRAVLQIWSAGSDLGSASRDVACNVAATFQILDGCLDMVVFCRSNDIIWGCYGANAVHLSMLMEYVASAVGVKIGTYTQISVNWHAYSAVFDPMLKKMEDVSFSRMEGSAYDQILKDRLYANPYAAGEVSVYPLMSTTWQDWTRECESFVTATGRVPTVDVMLKMKDPFFTHVAYPIVLAHDLYRDGESPSRFQAAIAALDSCLATDWRLACREWLERRAP